MEELEDIKNEKVNRMTKEQFIDRVKDYWAKFHDRMMDMTFEEFYKNSLEEFEKQNNMSDRDLKKYRMKKYLEMVSELNKMTTPEERQKFEEIDNRTLNNQATVIKPSED